MNNLQSMTARTIRVRIKGGGIPQRNCVPGTPVPKTS